MALSDAFRAGNPAKAWELTQQLLQLSRQAVIDAAVARFRANFGTPMCDNCEGLRAGPGVSETCFQRRQCYFANFKKGDMSPKHQRVIDTLLGGQKRG